MRTGSKKVLVVELNEITWDLIDPLMKRGLLPNFQALMAEGARGDAWASEEPEHLDPWVTWTTLYTGVPQSVHGLAMLEQDRDTVTAPRLWEYLRQAGLRVGLFGSANSWPPHQVDGFWVPGPFSRDFATYPAELEPIQALNVGLTRGHTTGSEGAAARPKMSRLVPQLMRMGLRPTTLALMAKEMLGIRQNPRTRWKMVALQPFVNLDLFSSLYRQYRPHFATFHSNHVAYYMHRFWRAMDPSAFEVAPSEDEKATYGRCIEHGYVTADRLLGSIRRMAGPDVNLAVLSSCGQQPATGGRYSDDQRQGHVGLQIRIRALLEMLGVADKATYSNLMAPQWKVDIEDADLRDRTAELIGRARNVTRDAPPFAVHLEGKSLCVGPFRNQQIDDSIELHSPSGTRQIVARELMEQHAEVAKSGRHHPKGVLLLHGPDVRRGTDIGRCDNLDIAPTLLHLLGQPVPRTMHGRVLDEALSVPAAREMAFAA
ncbi:MAG: hypothetical protein K0Q72_4400 [Armatimonadetes bacterium]|nr:hypothetical protein [Armatimonadota bacterium]